MSARQHTDWRSGLLLAIAVLAIVAERVAERLL
jgi:hypothetical protein